MPKLSFLVNNVKCAGCAQTIRQTLQNITEVETIDVNLTSGQVEVSGTAERSQLLKALAEVGYPEKLADTDS